MGESTGFLTAFLLPFHVIGGVAVGIAARRVIQSGFKLTSLASNAFLLLWGGMFGGMPLIFGLAMGPNWFFPLQLGVFLGTAALVAWQFEWLRDLYSQPAMWLASFGFIFFVIGAGLAVSLLAEGDTSGLIFGVVFGGVGGILTLVGVWMMLRSE
jgi:hypothetical protein